MAYLPNNDVFFIGMRERKGRSYEQSRGRSHGQLEGRSHRRSEGRTPEVVGVLLMTIALFLAISLVSYSQGDYSHSNRASTDVKNWAGRAGAYLADHLFFIFGYGWLPLPVIVLLLGWNCFRRKSFRSMTVRTVSLLFLVFLYCAVVYLPPFDDAHTPFRLGGLVGSVLSSQIIIPYFGRVGGMVLIGALGLLTVIFSTDLNVSGMAQRIVDRVTLWGGSFVGRLEKRSLEGDETEEEEEVKEMEEVTASRGRGKRGKITEGIVSEVKVKRESVVAPSMIELHRPKIVEDDRSKQTSAQQPEKAGTRGSRLDDQTHEDTDKQEVELLKGEREDELWEDEQEEIIYQYPPISLLDDPPRREERQTARELQENAERLEKALADFGIEARVVQVTPGPVITRYEVEPAPGTKVSRIVTLSDDLALVMKARRVRIQAPIPGKAAVGIELPNPKPSVVYLKEVVESEEFQQSSSKLLLALGRTASGDPFCADLARMPHLLIAGATGSGKTVAAETMMFTNRGMLNFTELCPLPFNSEANFHVRIASRDGVEITSKCYNHGLCHFYRIETDPGYAIDVTAEHPLWVMGENGSMEWRQGCQIQVGDYVAIARGTNLFGNQVDLSGFRVSGGKIHYKLPKIPTTLTPELGRFLGFLVADGGMTVKHRIVYTQADLSMIELYKEMIKNVFGISAPIVVKSGESNKSQDVVIQRKHLKEFLSYLGMTDVSSPSKEVPLSIRKASKEIVISFLQALMEHDGYISKNSLDLCVASEQLVRQVQLLLLNLGIVSSLKQKKVKGYESNRYWRLSIFGEELRRYVKIVGFLKSENYLKIEEHMRKPSNANNDLIPFVASLIKQLEQEYRKRYARLTNKGWVYTQGAQVPKYDFRSLHSYSVGYRSPSYEALGRILAFYEGLSDHPTYQKLQEIYEKRFYWVKVTKITEIEGEGYDFEVPGSHSFVGNGFINHNSVCINSLVSSLLFRASPEEVRLIMIDPKRIELAVYTDIPHLLAPVVVEAKVSAETLKWAVEEMERRYQRLAEVGVRNITDYNRRADIQPMSFVVIIVDELADLMMVGSRDIEEHIARLAQMARAVGIHLILATQRPSVNVITGVIKANFPARIAFQVASKIDSRIVLDTNGAENLLGSGDMLYLPPGEAEPIRLHGAYVSTQETESLVEFIRSQRIQAEHVDVSVADVGERERFEGRDELFEEAARTVVHYQQGSASLLQRRLKVGYARAARLIDELEAAGIVGPAEGSRSREVLVDEDLLEEMLRRDDEKT
ncbi:MAG: DNA translocase FtsK 4TM domain-containing protein [Candidatus Latescibacteria bacterium]|nr:DNA translocase FtsK 4TM domain-containing protein [Candidatus Latescibacterota bacterium]